MATSSNSGHARQAGAGVSTRAKSRTWGRAASTWDDSFKRTRYGYPSASARLAMQARTSRRARNRVVGSKLTHNATLGYISRGSARRHGLDDAGWSRYVPVVIVALVLVGALAGIGYMGHGESLGRLMGAFKGAELASPATEVVLGAQNQTGVASSRAIVAASNAYADAQKAEDEGDDATDASTSQADGSGVSTNGAATAASAGA